MFLVELVLQGVRGIRALARLRFQSGFNFVAAGNEAGKTTAVDAMQRLLFPSSQPGLMDELVSKHTPDASRAALVMCSDDGAYYRIIQDFSKRAVNLSKYNAGTKDFALMHKDWDNAVKFMAGLTTGMSEEDFAKVFVLRRDHYASNRTGAGAPARAAAPLPQALSRASAVPSDGKAAPNQKRLAELREQLKKAEESADAEYKAQSARLALDDITKKLTTLEQNDQKEQELGSSLAELKGCATLPENLSELLESHERVQGQKETEADALNKELEGVRMSLEAAPAVNFMTDKLFVAGAVAGILVFLAAFMFTLQQEVFLGVLLLSLVLMVVGWYMGSQKNAQRKAFVKEAATLEKELADLEKRFGQEGAAINASLKATGSSTTAELKDKAENYRYFLSLLEDIKEQRQRILGDVTFEALQQEYATRQQEAQALDQAARAVSQYNVDTYSIRQDIERLAGSDPGAAWDLGAEAREAPADFAAPTAGAVAGGFHAEIGIASKIGGIEMETLVPAVEAAAQRNLSAITGGKYVRIEVGHAEGPPIVHAKDDSVVNYAEQSHGMRDLVYFCIRTGLVEAIAGKRRLPFILDDPLASFDPARQKAACQILRALGTKTQVVLFSSNPALKAEGDAAAELK